MVEAAGRLPRSTGGGGGGGGGGGIDSVQLQQDPSKGNTH